jgi:hypothetical protein
MDSRTLAWDAGDADPPVAQDRQQGIRRQHDDAVRLPMPPISGIGSSTPNSTSRPSTRQATRSPVP